MVAVSDSHGAAPTRSTSTGAVTSGASTGGTLGANAGLEPSVFLHGMNNSRLPIIVAHGEGRASFTRPLDPNGRLSGPDISTQARNLIERGLVPLRYTTPGANSSPTEEYPHNPNGSPGGIAAVRSVDGRVLAVMPHPERAILGGVGSHIPAGELERMSGDGAKGGVGGGVKAGLGGDGEKMREIQGGDKGWGNYGPWIRLFRSARRWVG